MQQEFEKIYKDAYSFIDKGIVFITEGKQDEAAAYLQLGLDEVDKALQVKVESFDCPSEKIQEYKDMQLKMRCTRKEVLNHFSDIQAHNSKNGVSTNPPTYEECISMLNDGLGEVPGNISRWTLVCVPEEHRVKLRLCKVEANHFGVTSRKSPVVTPVMSPQSGEMIFKIEDGVQIFFIYKDDRVTSPSYPSFLAIFTFPEPIGGEGSIGGARGFLQVGEWSYPLVPSQSPVLHSFYGAYMFPDVTNTEQGTSVGIIIPDTVDLETKQLFEHILIQMTSYHHQSFPKGMDTSSATVITESASARIASGLVQVGQVGKATMALGRKFAPHLQRHGTKAISHFTGQQEKETDKQVEGVLEVAAGAVHGASTLYVGLEEAAIVLAKSLTNNTVKVVSHRYGHEAGSVTDDALNAIGLAALTGHNVTCLGAKGIAKRVAKDTGKALVLKNKEPYKTDIDTKYKDDMPDAK